MGIHPISRKTTKETVCGPDTFPNDREEQQSPPRLSFGLVSLELPVTATWPCLLCLMLVGNMSLPHLCSLQSFPSYSRDGHLGIPPHQSPPTDLQDLHLTPLGRESRSQGSPNLPRGQTVLPTGTSHGVFPDFPALRCGPSSAHAGAPSTSRTSGTMPSAAAAKPHCSVFFWSHFYHVHALPIAQRRPQTPPQLLPKLVPSPPQKIMQNIHFSV